jgi:hypothetical protein
LESVLTLLFALVFQATPPAAAQPAYTVSEIAAYRLGAPVFARFQRASHALARVIQDDPRLAADPPFTRDVSLLDDVVVAATTLDARLTREPAFTSALKASRIAPREYTTFALALFAARLAHGFVKSGAMRFVPDGVAKDNVAFIEAHEREVSDVLQALGLEEP